MFMPLIFWKYFFRLKKDRNKKKTAVHFSNIAEDILHDLSVVINFAWKLVISKFEFYI